MGRTTDLGAVFFFALSFSMHILAADLLPEENPFVRDGRLMSQAVVRDDLPTERLLLQRGYVLPNGYTETNGRAVAFLNEALTSHSLKSIQLLLERGATELSPGAPCPKSDQIDSGLVGLVSGQGYSLVDLKTILGELLARGIGNFPAEQHTYAPQNCGFRYPISFSAFSGRSTDERIGRFQYLASVGLRVNDSDGWGVTLAHLLAARAEVATDADIAEFKQLMETLKKGGGRLDQADNNGLLPVDFAYLIYVGTILPTARCAKKDLTVPDAKLKSIEQILINLGSRPARTFATCPANLTYCVPC